MIGNVRVYPDNVNGRDKFGHDIRDYNSLYKSKQKIISKLMKKMEEEVRTKVTTHPDYAPAFRRYDVLRIWQITEEIVQGRGAASIYAMITALLDKKQKKDYATYSKEFKQLVNDVTRQGDKEMHKRYYRRFLTRCSLSV